MEELKYFQKLMADCWNTENQLKEMPVDEDSITCALGTEADPVEMAEMFRLLRELYEAADRIKKHYGKAFDWLRVYYIPNRMDDLGASSIKLPGLGRLGLTDDLRVKTLDKDGAFRWLEDQDLGDLITETINASTLKATLRRMLKKGEQVPDDLFELVPFTRANLTKS